LSFLPLSLTPCVPVPDLSPSSIDSNINIQQESVPTTHSQGVYLGYPCSLM
jgi:hypothetical protein